MKNKYGYSKHDWDGMRPSKKEKIETEYSDFQEKIDEMRNLGYEDDFKKPNDESIVEWQQELSDYWNFCD